MVITHVEVVEYAFLKIQGLCLSVLKRQPKQIRYNPTILVAEVSLEVYSEMASLVAAAASAA